MERSRIVKEQVREPFEFDISVQENSRKLFSGATIPFGNIAMLAFLSLM
jgi:hypothetical protein